MPLHPAGQHLIARLRPTGRAQQLRQLALGALSGLFSSIVKTSAPGSGGEPIDVVQANGTSQGLMGTLLVGLTLFFWSFFKD